ncbi:hypothetical protein OZX68_04390 [Streptococcaceae bacterium ESL0729]|nr:hypothetical protein OZX68_04390 [Streptococcaceae bacterium ESL0729]
METKKTQVNYKEIAIFTLLLVAIVLVLLKVLPSNLRYGILIAVSISMIILPITRKKVIDRDERNYQIDIKAKAFAFDMLDGVFGLLLLTFSIMQVDFLILVLTLTAYLILKMANLLMFSYYHKNY